MVGVALVLAASVALAPVHGPDSTPVTAIDTTTGPAATGKPPLTIDHTALVDAVAAPTWGTCATSDADQDGAAFALARVPCVIAVTGSMPPTSQRTVASASRRSAVRRRGGLPPLPQAPDLHALCICRR